MSPRQTKPAEPTAEFPYRIERKIGEGGMGAVFRAIEPALNRVVAIKRLKLEALSAGDPDVAQETRSRFLREARAAAALSHPGITAIYRTDSAGLTRFRWRLPQGWGRNPTAARLGPGHG